jgi:hypothetical protein
VRERGEDLAELLDERDAGTHVRVDDASATFTASGTSSPPSARRTERATETPCLLLRLVGGCTEVRGDDHVEGGEQTGRRSRLRTGRSTVKTSSPAPASSPAVSARDSASSSMRPPRATLTT